MVVTRETLQIVARLEHEMAAAGRTVEQQALRAVLSAVARPEMGFLSLEQAAEALHISVSMARLFLERGALEGSEVDGRWFVTKDSVDHILGIRRASAELDDEGTISIEDILRIRRRIRSSSR